MMKTHYADPRAGRAGRTYCGFNHRVLKLKLVGTGATCRRCSGEQQLGRKAAQVKQPVDNLPLDGIVLLDGLIDVQYRGYLAHDFNKCAVKEGPMDVTDWVDRSRLGLKP